MLETSRLDSLPGPLVWRIKRKSRVDSVEDIDDSFYDLFTKRCPHQHQVANLPSTILANIHEKNKLMSLWQIRSDPAAKNRINRLQSCIEIELKERRNAQRADTLECLNSKDQSLWKTTKRVMRLPDTNPPLLVAGVLAYSASECQRGREVICSSTGWWNSCDRSNRDGNRVKNRRLHRSVDPSVYWTQ